MSKSGHSNGADAWRSVDTVANLRALGEVQRRGLDAANEIIGRLVDRTEAGEPLFGADAAGPAGRSTDPFAQLADLMRSGYAAMLATVSRVPTMAGFTTSRPEGISTDALVLEPVAPGAESTGELWLHNRSGADVRDVRLHCGDLRTHDGWAVAAGDITFSPGGEFELPDRTSRGIRVSVAVSGNTAPGVYRGTVLAANLADVWLPVELVVTPPSR